MALETACHGVQLQVENLQLRVVEQHQRVKELQGTGQYYISKYHMPTFVTF